jgi:ankyrin repeat protein
MKKTIIRVILSLVVMIATKSSSLAQDGQKLSDFYSISTAIKAHDLSTVEQIIEKGIDLGFVPQNQPTILAQCIAMGNVEVTELILSKGADANQDIQFPDGSVFSPLMMTIMFYCQGMINEIRKIELLLEHGADPNNSIDADDDIAADGTTPLMLSASNTEFEDTELVELLLNAGADVNKRSTLGFTALMMAIREGNNEIAGLLLENDADVNARIRSLEEVQSIYPELDEYLQIVIKENGGSTVLHVALDGAELEIIELLLTWKSDVNAANANGITPLHKAAETGYKYLSRIDPTTTEAKDNFRVAEMLLKYGASINVQDHKGETPLHKAALEGNASIVQFLLQQGADPKIKSFENKTAFDLANENEHEAVSVILRKYL